MIVPFVTLALLFGFLHAGYMAHWFDFLLTGAQVGCVDLVWSSRAATWLAALLGWSMRNDLSVLWGGSRS